MKVKEDKVRAPHDWLNAVCPLNSALANPFVQYGTMDESSSLTAPGAVMSGIDLQDCFLHWLAAPSRRRLLGVFHPATGFLGAYIHRPLAIRPLYSYRLGWGLPRVGATLVYRRY